MDKDIKRLLSLRANPHFQLSASELEKIENWEKAQKKVEIKEPVVIEAPEGYEVSEGIGDGEKPTIMPEVKKPRRKKTKNVITEEEKETGEIEE